MSAFAVIGGRVRAIVGAAKRRAKSLGKPTPKPKPAPKRQRKSADPPPDKSARERRRDLELRTRDAASKRKRTEQAQRADCSAERRTARKTCEVARATCTTARAVAASACAVRPELAEARRTERTLRGELDALRAADPRTHKVRRARELRAERLQLEAENLPAAWRPAFLRAARAGTIKTTTGHPPRALWERFREMAQADPSLVREKRARPSGKALALEQARAELEQAEREGRGRRARELRAYLADPKGAERLARLEAEARRLRKDLRKKGAPPKASRPRTKAGGPSFEDIPF